MQIQPGFYTHAHPAPAPAPAPPNNHIHSDSIHSDPRSQQRPGYTNGHINGNAAPDMNPYHQHPYGPPGYGYNQPPLQQRYPAPPTLPPMQTSMGAPPLPPGPVPNSGPPSYAPHQPPHLIGGPPPPQRPQPGPSIQPPRRPQLTYSGRDDNYEYTLVVEQQPQRARMCGFGDKDRRPITPPPCIRLIITNLKTGKEVDFEDIDGSFFVLQVDLWDDLGQREVNIVRASSSSPAVSISTATTTSFPPTPERTMLNEMGQPLVSYGPDGQTVVYQGYPRQPAPYGAGYQGSLYNQQAYPGAPVPFAPQAQSNSAMFTRNLIGSLTVNASRLSDTTGKPGYWFVLQDLSVRTEGYFRYVLL